MGVALVRPLTAIVMVSGRRAVMVVPDSPMVMGRYPGPVMPQRHTKIGVDPGDTLDGNRKR